MSQTKYVYMGDFCTWVGDLWVVGFVCPFFGSRRVSHLVGGGSQCINLKTAGVLSTLRYQLFRYKLSLLAGHTQVLNAIKFIKSTQRVTNKPSTTIKQLQSLFVVHLFALDLFIRSSNQVSGPMNQTLENPIN